MITNYEWREFPTNDVVFPYASRFWQKRLFTDGDRKLFAEIVEYNPVVIGGPQYEVVLHISEDFSPVEKDINVKVFTYRELDFDKMEQDARKILSALTGVGVV